MYSDIYCGFLLHEIRHAFISDLTLNSVGGSHGGLPDNSHVALILLSLNNQFQRFESRS